MGKRHSTMSASDAMDLAESMDLPDGAYMAMVEELSGLDYCDAMTDEMERSDRPAKKKKKKKVRRCSACNKRFRSRQALDQHVRDAHGAKESGEVKP